LETRKCKKKKKKKRKGEKLKINLKLWQSNSRECRLFFGFGLFVPTFIQSKPIFFLNKNILPWHFPSKRFLNFYFAILNGLFTKNSFLFSNISFFSLVSLKTTPF
jgi:hypothetical protein